MVSRLLMVCSGSTLAARKAVFPINEPVEKKSALRAAKLVGHLPDARRFWSSPALNARQTVESLSLQALEMPELKDQDYGAWGGKSVAELEVSDRQGLARFFSDPQASPPGGESLLDVAERARRLLDALMTETGCTIAVTHPAIIRAAIVHVLGAPAECVWKIDIEPLSVTDLRSDGKRWTLRSSAWVLMADPVG